MRRYERRAGGTVQRPPGLQPVQMQPRPALPRALQVLQAPRMPQVQVASLLRSHWQ